MQTNKLLALLLSIQIGSQLSQFGDFSTKFSSNKQTNSTSFSQLLKQNEIDFMDLKSGNQPLYYGTFKNVKEENISTCTVSTTNSQQVELKSAREENLKLQKTIGELRGIISQSGGLCTIDEKSLEKELDILKKANLYIIQFMEKSSGTQISSSGQLSLDILNDLRLSMSKMQGQGDQILELLLQVQLKQNENTCSDLQITLEQEMQRILTRLEESFAKQDNLLKTNQDLNSLILNLQQEKEGLMVQISSQREQQIQTQNLQNQNQDIERIISSIQNGDQEMEQVMNQLRIIASSNQALTSRLERMENNDQNGNEFDNLRQQNSQLQILVKNLGDQLFEQTQIFRKQQDFENRFSNLEVERDLIAQRLADKTKDFEELKLQNKTQLESLNSQLETLKIDLAVTKSGQNALESRLQDSKGQFSNFTIILSENKNLTEQLTKCLAEKEIVNKNMTNLNAEYQSVNQCNNQFGSPENNIKLIQEGLLTFEKQSADLKTQVAIISSLGSQIEGLKQQNEDLRNTNSQLSGLQDQFKSVQNELKDRNSLLLQINSLQSENQNEKDQCQNEVRQLQSQIDQSQSKLQQCSKEKESISQQFISSGNNNESEMTDLRRQNLELNKQATQFETLNSECRSSLNFFLNVEAQIRAVQERLNETLQENKKIRNDNQILQNDKASQALEIATIPQLKNQLTQLENQNKALLNFSSTIDGLQNSIKSNQASQNQIEQTRIKFQTEIDSCNDELNQYKLQLNESISNVQSLTQRNQDLQENIQQLREGNNGLQSLGESNQQLLDRIFQLESKTQSCGAVEQNLQNTQSTMQSAQEELKLIRSEASECKMMFSNARDSLLSFEAQVQRIPILERALNNAEQQVSDLRNKNNSFVNIQSQVTDFLKQLREKQSLEVENAQLKRDLENLRNFSGLEQQKFTDQISSLNNQLTTCNVATKTLQDQLIQMRNSDGNTKQLQTDFNNSQNRLRVLEDQNNGFIQEIRGLNEFKIVFDKQVTQFGQLQNDLRKCQENLQTQRGDISSLKLQTSQIPNYQAQIEKLGKQVTDLEGQNRVLLNLNTQIKTITDNNERIQNLNDQIRSQAAEHNRIQEVCQRQKTQLELQVNTFKQEFQTCKSQNDQLQIEIQEIGNNQGTTQQTFQQENSVIRQNNLQLQGEVNDCKFNIQRLQQENSRISTLTESIQQCNQDKKDLEKRTTDLLVKVEIIDQLNQNNAQLNNQVQTLQKELQNYQNLRDQIERFQSIFSQNVSLNAEINRLKDLLANSQNSSQNSQGELQLQISQFKNDLQNCRQSRQQLENSMQRLEQGNDNFSTIFKENRSLSERILQLTNQHQDCEKRVAQTQQTSQQITNLTQQLKDNNKKLEDCSSEKVSLLIQTNTIPQFQERIQELQLQIQNLNGKNQSLNEINSELAGLRGILTEKNNLQFQLDGLRKELATNEQECNSKLSDLKVQIQTVSSNLNNCTKKGEALQTQVQTFTSSQPDIQKIQQQNAALNSQISQQRDSLTVSQTTIETLRNQLGECKGLQNSLNNSNQQLQGLQTTIIQLREEITRCNQNDAIISQLRVELQNKNALQVQLDQLRSNAGNSQNKIDELNTKISLIQNANQGLNTQLNQCNQQRQQESADLRAQIQEKENTIRELNQRIVILTNESNNFKTEIQNLNQSIQSSSSSSQNLSGQIRELQNQRSDLQERINQLTSQLQIASSSLTIKTQELQQFQAQEQSSLQKINSLQSQLNALQNNYQILQNELSTCNQQKSQLQEQNLNLTSGLQESKSQATSLQIQLKERQGQLDILNINLTNSQKAITDLNSQLSSLKTRLQSSSQSQSTQIQALSQEKDKLISQVDQLTQNNQTLLIQLQELTVQIEDCGRVRQQRDLYARQLISFQNRLQQFRNNVLINIPNQETQSVSSNNAQSSQATTTTQTIRTTNIDGQQQISQSSSVQQQLTKCLAELQSSKNNNEQLVLRVERNQELSKNDY